MNKQILDEDIKQFAETFELTDQLRGATFLITGATGLIGSVLTKCLLEINYQNHLDLKIIVCVRNQKKAESVFGNHISALTILTMDFSNDQECHKIPKVDYVIHLASPTASSFFVEKPVETLRTAIEGTDCMLAYARQADIKAMVYASSLEVYGSNLTDEWIKEDFQGYVNPTEVRSSYNIGKRACECLCHSYAKEYGVNVMIARMTQTFGAGVEYNDNRVFAQFARNAVEGKDIELHTEGKTCRMYCYTIDAVSAMLYLILKGKRGEAYNIANKDSYISIRDMALLIKDSFNKNINVVFVPKEGQGYAPETRLRLDTEKIESLGWKPQYGIKTMFERLLKSFIHQ